MDIYGITQVHHNDEAPKMLTDIQMSYAVKINDIRVWPVCFVVVFQALYVIVFLVSILSLLGQGSHIHLLNYLCSLP